MPSLSVGIPSLPNDCTCRVAGAIYETGRQTCVSLHDLSLLQPDSKEDLLRAMLIFACSTIDSVGKQLTRDCLTELIDTDQGAQKTFEDFISRQIEKEPRKILARALSSPDYRGELIRSLKESIEGKSLQSYPQISELTARFGVVTDDVISRPDGEKVFDARQKIIHEMDIDILTPSGTAAQRRRRAENELKELTEQALNATNKLIQQVHDKIHEPRAVVE